MAKDTKNQDQSLLNGGIVPESKTEAIGLKQNLGLMSGTAMIVGTMIGSGIFVSPRGVLEASGSVAMSLVVWVGCGILAMLGALTYAELGTAIPRSGAEHAYLMFTFSGMNKCWGAVPGFLYDWLGVLIIRPAMFAIMALSLGTYVTQPFYGDCEAPLMIKKIATVVAMCVIGLINCYSVRAATKVQNFTTISKLVAAAVIIIGGIYMMAIGNVDNLQEGFEDTKEDPSLLAFSFYNGLWAYDGWNNLNFMTEELKNAKRNLPLAIVIGIPLTTVVYFLVNIGYFAVMSKEEIMLSDAVAVLWGKRMLGVMSWIMPVFVVLSCFGAANGCLFASGRLCYVAGREGHLPEALSYIHIKRFTPVPSLMFTVFMGVLLILPGDLGSLIEFFSFTAWIFYGLTATALIILRVTHKDLPRPYKVPLIIPILVVCASVYLIIAPIANNPRVEFLYACIFLFSGLFLYFPFVYGKYQPSWANKVTKYVQILLMISFPESE